MRSLLTTIHRVIQANVEMRNAMYVPETTIFLQFLQKNCKIIGWRAAFSSWRHPPSENPSVKDSTLGQILINTEY